MMQQAHYFAPVRPPSPTHLFRVDHSTHLAEYVSSLLPPPPSPFPRKRSRSTSPSPTHSTPTRSNTAPLPALQRSPSLSPPLRPASPASSSSAGRIPFPSFRPPSPAFPPRRSATTGPGLVSDAPPPSPSGTPKPSFPSLSRTPSQAFVAASKEGRVHPLTLAAVARRDSEHEALRLVRERKETERRRENSAEETSGGTAPSAAGGSRPPALLRKQSWTAAGQAVGRMAGMNGVGGGGSRSESPTPLEEGDDFGAAPTSPRGAAAGSGSGRRGKTHLAGRGLGLVGEEDEGASSTGPSGAATPSQRQASADTVLAGPPSSAASSSGTFRSASASTPLPASPTSAGGMRSASSASFGAPSIAPSAAPTERTKRRSLFSRFSRSGRSISQSSANGAVPALPSSPLVSEFGAMGARAVESPGWEKEKERKESGKKEKEREGEKVRFAKVKTKGKSTKDFGRLFLAQELFIPPSPSSSSPPSSGFRPQPPAADDTASLHSVPDTASQHSHAPTEEGGGGGGAAGGRKKKNAVWALKWSEDGRYLAVGGKDGVVRVWEVLSTPEDRHSAMHPSSASSQQPFTDSPTTSSPSADSPPLSRHSFTQPSYPLPTPSSIASGSTFTSPSGGRKKTSTGPGPGEGKTPVSVMPVFAQKPVREFRGHEADVLDLSWSKNNFLLSSSMDKTVRLWHVSRAECLCAFQHLDFVTSIAFHPKDDRFFLSGSLDCKLRLWNIPEKRVHIWTELPELITSVAFTRDGKLAIAGSFVGICMFFEVSTFRYHSQFAAKSTRGKNAKGKKVTSLCAFPRPTSMGERLLVTTNDSRIRLYHTLDKVVETKYAGHENTSSQIRASFSDDGAFIISGSEDRHVYIWDSGLHERGEKGSGLFHLQRKNKDGSGYECFPMSAHIVTAALFAPATSRSILAAAGDPIFADGHTHAVPLALAQTVSSASGTCESSESGEGGRGEKLAPALSRAGGGVKVGGAEDAIVVVADDETGVISIFRNSSIPADTSLLGEPVMPSPFFSAGLDGGATGSGLERSGSKRWSRGGR